MLFSLLKFAAISGVITLLIPFVLIASQPVKTLTPPAATGLDFSGQLGGGADLAQTTTTTTLRDGTRLVTRIVPGPDHGPLMVLLHGSGWHGMQFAPIAAALSEHATLVIPDLRGHGAHPARRGDIDHLGQYDEDIADLITAHRRPGQKVVVAGHSSGGGLALRFAAGPYGDRADAAILLAPFLKYNAPTTRPNSGGWAVPLTRRLIGLSMLNGFGITALNHLTVMQFNMPAVVLDGPLGATATTAYSYRLNTSYAPRNDYLGDIAKLPPFLLIAGTKDEAFFADQYAPTMSAVTDKGDYRLVNGVNHLDIVTNPETLLHMKAFLDARQDAD